MHQDYTLGFAFDWELNVALVRKNRPEWQAGKLNGIGGHVEETDCSYTLAQKREFKEETGLRVPLWTPFAKMKGPGWDVLCFCAFEVTLHQVRTMTDEEIIVVPSRTLPKDVLPNLRWMIPMALSLHEDNNFNEAVVQYHK